jgi:hypothetical protein
MEVFRLFANAIMALLLQTSLDAALARTLIA